MTWRNRLFNMEFRFPSSNFFFPLNVLPCLSAGQRQMPFLIPCCHYWPMPPLTTFDRICIKCRLTRNLNILCKVLSSASIATSGPLALPKCWSCCDCRASITPGEVVCAEPMNHFESFCGSDWLSTGFGCIASACGCGHMDPPAPFSFAIHHVGSLCVLDPLLEDITISLDREILSNGV